MEAIVSFGQLLRELRAGAGLTQEELAQAAALSTRAVSDLERGISLTARKDTAKLLADALHLAGREREMFEASARGHSDPGGMAAASRTLPRDVISFADRAGELREVADAAGAGGVCAIGGMAGVGKTAFAVRAAHQLAPLFPDGQIFLPLHAHAAGRHPVRPADALASLLQTIGIAPARIPASPEARAGLWRDRLAGRQLLLLLDDAAGTDQVRPLLPGTGGILVLITSRAHLTALEEARVISLDTLPPGDASALLARLAGRPGLVAADPAVAEIADLCGRLPLALCMIGRQLCHHPAWSPAAVAADLAAARDRLEYMHAENISVAAAFARSYQDLSASQRRMFRLLGLHPGADTDAPAAAALAGISPGQARRDLEGLYDRYLLTEPAQGRYRFHELIREHARALAAAMDPAEREAAMTRLLDYYLCAARAAARTLDGPGPAGPGSPEDGVAWMAAERLNLHAAALYAASSGRPEYAVGIATAMHEFLREQGHWDQAITLDQAALAAARRAGSRPAEAGALLNLGELQFLADDYPAAGANLTAAEAICRSLGDRAGQAAALTSLSAVQHATGNSNAAVTTLARAVEMYRDLGDGAGQASALTCLGAVQHAAGDDTTAAATLAGALDKYRDAGSLPGQAGVLTELGAVQQAVGDPRLAAESRHRALAIYRRLGDRLGEAGALNKLGSAQRLAGQYADAEASHASALALCRELGDQSGQAEALEGTGLCQLSQGNQQRGRELLQQAMAIYARIGSPRVSDIERLLAAPEAGLNGGQVTYLAANRS
ncbi:MAG TPA: helix-turn-helix transcriptional regulator [Streptosporangiaceae bacterium]|nr:helix-turn-helix transcriptional regulator [Streptosporangiaceae bacterium]